MRAPALILALCLALASAATYAANLMLNTPAGQPPAWNDQTTVNPQKSWVTTVTTGSTVTIPDGITLAVLNSSSALSSLTVILPANPVDGQPLSLEIPKGVTLLTMSPNTGQVVSNGFTITALAVNSPARLKYAAVNTTWYPN